MARHFVGPGTAEGHCQPHPRGERRRPVGREETRGSPYFREGGGAVYELDRPTWKNRNHITNWWRTLEKYALPSIGTVPIDRLTCQDVLGVLAPIWTSKPETARRVRQRIHTVLRWAMAHHYVIHNVGGEAIDGALP